VARTHWLLIGALAVPTLASAKANLDDINRIRDQGLYHSQVMTTLQQLTDGIGPRLTGSPQMQAASKWTVAQLQDWGLSNVHLEGFEFGRGWSYDNLSINLLSPRKTSLHAIPVAWTPGTEGAIEGDIAYLDAVNADELKQYHGKLAGKIVLLSEPLEIKEPQREIFKRYTAQELGDMKNLDLTRPASNAPSTPDLIVTRRARLAFRDTLSQFLKDEEVKAAIYRSSRDGGLINIFGHNRRAGKTFLVPAVVLSAEHYNMLARMLDLGITPRVSLSVDARFNDGDSKSYNTIAEIPGSGKSPGIVMLGAHLDSWHACTGGVDNAAGSAVAMEVMRILKALNVAPKRTIRLALWSGEEQGLIGSRAYVASHLASRPPPTDPKERELDPGYWSSPGWPITTLPEYDRLSVYFNVDNGSGKFRGIYTEGNVAVKPIFADWFGAVSDLSDGIISQNATGGTDHESFDDVGLPGFQFIQDELDYGSRLHHTDIDSFDHVLPEDMKQAAVVMATLVYDAAMADERLPRKPMPAAPSQLEKKQDDQKAAQRQRAKERKALGDLLK
jgi:carboxypeptidase Q